MNVTFRAGVITPQTQDNQPKPTEPTQTNVTSTLNSAKPANVLVDKNYGSLQVKQMKVAFKGLPAPLPKGPSLGEKITGLFDILKSNEVILVGKNVRTAIKDLETHLDEMDKAKKKTLSPFRKVIKKIFFVEDKNIENTMGFTKNGADREFTNMSQRIHFINDAKTKEQYFIKPNETIYLSPNDSLRTPEGKVINFDANTKAIPNKIKEDYAKVIDMTQETEPTIKQINKRNLNRLTIDPTKAQKPIMFSDVGGMDNTIREIKELIVYPIQHPELKGKKRKINKSILLEGPPGTGKSLLGEATANESNAYYRYIKGSELDSKFVGESESNVRALINEARENQPAIIFLDEVDAVAQKRDGNSDTYGKKVLNAWLAEISASEKRGDDIYFIAATNNVKSLDTAMTRGGRFGNVIHVGIPDEKGVKQIFDIHRKDMPFDEKFNVDKYTKELHKRKATGSDIASAVEEAERFAKRREGIYEKLDNGTYKPEDMEKLRIKDEDFDLALKGLEKRKALEAEQLKNNDLASEIAEYKALNKERREEIEKLKAQQAERNKPRPQIGFNADRYKDRKSND